jgi:hypothetical protein
MAGNGNHPLKHYDEDTLHEYILGQLLPDDEEQVRQHLAVCPLCRAAAADMQVFTRRLSLDLRRSLDQAEPSPRLSFDQVVPEWRKPPRRVALIFRLQQLAPGASIVLLLALFVIAIFTFFPSDNTAALRDLELTDNYDGPPAVVAAFTGHGLAVVRLAPDDVHVEWLLSDVYRPRDLAFSPDGRWLAFQDGRVLYVLAAQENGVSFRFATQATAEWAWSPDSLTLAYTDGKGQLATFDTLTETTRVLVPSNESAWGVPVWSADSRQIAYAVVKPLPASGQPLIRQGIWRVAADTGYRVELARNPAPHETILVPAAWDSANTVLLAWDVKASATGEQPTLYRVDVSGHNLESIVGISLAQGTRLAWPVGPQGTVLVTQQNRLVALTLGEDMSSTQPALPAEVPWPTALEWAPNGAWFAYTVAGAAEGKGIYLFALAEGELRSVELPEGAAEKAAFWAGAEHLFVIRQPSGAETSELWMVPLTNNQPPQRIMAYLRLPTNDVYNGWRWQDILAAQVITP